MWYFMISNYLFTVIIRQTWGQYTDSGSIKPNNHDFLPGVYCIDYIITVWIQHTRFTKFWIHSTWITIEVASKGDRIPPNFGYETGKMIILGSYRIPEASQYCQAPEHIAQF